MKGPTRPERVETGHHEVAPQFIPRHLSDVRHQRFGSQTHVAFEALGDNMRLRTAYILRADILAAQVVGLVAISVATDQNVEQPHASEQPGRMGGRWRRTLRGAHV